MTEERDSAAPTEHGSRVRGVGSYLRDGWALLRTAPSIIMPVAMFLLIEKILGDKQSSTALRSDNVWRALYLLLNPTVVAALLASFIIKTVSLVYSNADMYLASKEAFGRFSRIRSFLGWRDWILLLLISLSWNVLFGAIGLTTLYVFSVLIPSNPFVPTAALGVALFPIYYGGVSIGSMVYIFLKLGETSPGAAWRRILAQRLRVYKYYLLRSLLDASILFLVPLIWVIITRSRVVGAIGILFTIIPMTAYLRAAYVSFKTNLLIAEPHRQDEPKAFID